MEVSTEQDPHKHINLHANKFLSFLSEERAGSFTKCHNKGPIHK